MVFQKSKIYASLESRIYQQANLPVMQKGAKMVIERWRPGSSVSPWNGPGDTQDTERRFEDFITRPMWPRKSNGDRLWIPLVDIFEKEDIRLSRAETR